MHFLLSPFREYANTPSFYALDFFLFDFLIFASLHLSFFSNYQFSYGCFIDFIIGVLIIFCSFSKELLKNTPQTHPSFEILTIAANKIDRVVLSINETKKKAENNLRLAEISARFESHVINSLLLPNSLFIVIANAM